MYFVSLAAWLSFRHAKLTAGREGRIRILAIECVSFFLFFPHPTALAFFHDQTHTLTQTRKVQRHVKIKAKRRQKAVRFTRFLDYRLIFDSGRSVSLKYHLIRPRPY